jgi:hypothetical protein
MGRRTVVGNWQGAVWIILRTGHALTRGSAMATAACAGKGRITYSVFCLAERRTGLSTRARQLDPRR